MNINNLVVKYKLIIISCLLLLVIVLGYGMSKLTVNSDTRVFFSDDNPQLQALERLENDYTKTKNVIIAVSPKNGDVFTRSTLALLEEITELSWKTPFSNRVDSITNFPHITAINDDLQVKPLIKDAKTLTISGTLNIKEIALAEPQLVNTLISSSGHVAAVNISVILPGKATNEVKIVADFARNLIKTFKKKHGNIDFYLSGSVVADTAFAEASEKDMIKLIPLMFFVLIVLIGVSLRSITSIFITVIIILFSVVTGMGFAGWIGISLSSASSVAPVIIMTLAVADCIHILDTMFKQIKQNKTKEESIIYSIQVNQKAVFLTSITTAIGFLSMNFSDVPPFRDMGNIVAVGILGAYVYSMLLLPALLLLLPVKFKQTVYKVDGGVWDRFASFIIQNRRLVFWAMFIVVTLLSLGLSRIKLNDNFLKNFDQSFAFRRANDFLEENLTGLDVIEYSLPAEYPGGINNPKYLEILDKFAGWYRTHPKVMHISSMANVVKTINRNMNQNKEEYYRIPSKKDLIAQYLLMYKLSLPFGLDLNNRINADESATKMVVTFKNKSSAELRAMDELARNWLAQNAPKYMYTYGSGLSIIWAHISERNIKSMFFATLMAVLVISGILIIAFRSIKIGLLSLIPNLLPAIVSFGIWGLFVTQVGLGIAVTISMTLGIVVDDTIHFINKYLLAKRKYKKNSLDAVRFSFNMVGSAMLITTVSLAAGFLVLVFSGYRINSDMGLITMMTIVLALVMDFLFLPTLMMKLDV